MVIGSRPTRPNSSVVFLNHGISRISVGVYRSRLLSGQLYSHVFYYHFYVFHQLEHYGIDNDLTIYFYPLHSMFCFRSYSVCKILPCSKLVPV